MGDSPAPTELAVRAPPADGPLAPVPGGWSVQRLEHRRLQRAAPERVQRSVLAATTGGTAVLLLGGLALASAGIAWPLAILPYLFPLLHVTGAPARLAEHLVRRRFARTAIVGALDDVRSGARVKVRGRVTATPSFIATPSERPAVLQRVLGTITRVEGELLDGVGKYLDETRGIDFALELPSGQVVEIAARGAFLLDAPATEADASPLFEEAPPTSAGTDARGPYEIRVRAEVRIEPGDTVEVQGILDRRPSPRGEGIGRAARLVPVLRAGLATPLLVTKAHSCGPASPPPSR